jgi:hypothetical protein
MASELLVNSEDGWNDIFLARDVDGNEEDLSEDESDSDYEAVVSRSLSDSEDEVETGPAIELRNTQILRQKWEGKSLVEPIKYVLAVMDRLGINLPIFLDALSWGDADCIQDAKVRYARSSLMKSKELPGILRCWWRPPRSAGSKNKCARGAGPAMESFAAECTQHILNRELEAIAAYLVSPMGEDITEETLTSLVFREVIEDMKNDAPILWQLLCTMAYTPDQQKRNTEKNPDKVSVLIIMDPVKSKVLRVCQ